MDNAAQCFFNETTGEATNRIAEQTCLTGKDSQKAPLTPRLSWDDLLVHFSGFQTSKYYKAKLFKGNISLWDDLVVL